MKKLTLLFLVLGVGILNAQPVKLVTGEWDPYTSSTREGKGFFTEVVDAVMKEAGIPYTLDFVPWKRAEEMVKTGQSIAAFPYAKTEERLQTYSFSKVVTTSTGRFFFLKTKFPTGVDWAKFEDLRTYTVGGTLGYWYEKPFRDAGLRLDLSTEEVLSFRKLSLGRIDLVASEELVGWELLKKEKLSLGNFAVSAKPLDTTELHLMGLKSSTTGQEFLKKFDAALDSIKTKGIYQGILKKYNLQ